MKSSEFEQSKMSGPPKELFELERALDEADVSIEKCLSIMQNPKADFQKPQLQKGIPSLPHITTHLPHKRL